MNGEINLKLTWKHIASTLGGMAGLLFLAVGAFWAVNTQVFGDTKRDVEKIREILQDLAKADTTIQQLMSGADVDLRSDISQTREIVARNEEILKFVRADLSDIKGDVRDLRKDVTFLVQNTRK